MSEGSVEKVYKTAPHKKRLKEKKKMQKSILGSLFLEVLLRKVFEKELLTINHQKKKRKQLAIETNQKNEKLLEDKQEEDTAQEGLAEIPAQNPWTKTDSLEIGTEKEEKTPLSDSYNQIAGMLKCAAYFSGSPLYYEVYQLYKEVYHKKTCIDEIEKRFAYYCKKEYETIEREPEASKNIETKLQQIYEYFMQTNYTAAVAANNGEGRNFVENSGLHWRGTTYYNSYYYYKSKRIQENLQKTYATILEEYQLKLPDFEQIERKNRFALHGNSSYHSIWQWTQQKNNGPYWQYGLRDINRKPPEQFIYCYQNEYQIQNHRQLSHIRRKIRQISLNHNFHTLLWKDKIVTEGNDFHNGRSYLLETENENAVAEGYQSAMLFLENFKVARLRGCTELLYVGNKREKKNSF